MKKEKFKKQPREFLDAQFLMSQMIVRGSFSKQELLDQSKIVADLKMKHKIDLPDFDDLMDDEDDEYSDCTYTEIQ